MPAAASVPSGPTPTRADEGLADLSPQAIRAGLLPDEVETFDAQFRASMAEASEHLDLTGVLEFLRHWRLIAAASTAEPAAHREIMATAARLAAGEDVPTEPWSTTKARLGL